MTVTDTALGDTDGYWTIQVVNRDRAEIGRRYLCHARNDIDAQSIAGRLAGSDRGVVGYDYHHIGNPPGRYADALAMGQSEPIDDADAWAALQAARRSA